MKIPKNKCLVISFVSAHHVHSKAVVYEHKGLFLPRLYLKMSGHVTRVPAGGTLNLMGNKSKETCVIGDSCDIWGTGPAFKGTF